MADASLWISITALVISTATALVGLILNYLSHKKTFDPILVIKQVIRLNNRSDICIKNIGRGSAYKIILRFYYGNKSEFYFIVPLDILSPNEQHFIEKSMYIKAKIIKKSHELLDSADSLEKLVEKLKIDKKVITLAKLTYFNESNKRRDSFFSVWGLQTFMSISKKEYKKALKEKN